MKSLVILIVMVTTVHCNICCYPNEWQSTVNYLLLDSSPDAKAVVPLLYDEYFDTKDEIVRTDIHHYNLSVLTLYKENITYIFNDKQCSNYTPGSWDGVIHCIPSNAKPSPKFRLGLAPGIDVVDYIWTGPSGEIITVGVTNNCTPVLQQILFRSENLQDIEYNIQEFENFVPHVDDPKKFIVPDICKHKNELLPVWPLMGDAHHHLVKKYVEKRFKL
ncbi:hypothetical protein ACF0H5_000691 [Mactra antiquata]